MKFTFLTLCGVSGLFVAQAKEPTLQGASASEIGAWLVPGAAVLFIVKLCFDIYRDNFKAVPPLHETYVKKPDLAAAIDAAITKHELGEVKGDSGKRKKIYERLEVLEHGFPALQVSVHHIEKSQDEIRAELTIIRTKL